MQKVALRHSEYMANLPPYRFAPGDVIEIEDDWADQLVRRGIAKKAPKNAMTAIEKRQMMREDGVEPTDLATARAQKRAQLQAEMDALDEADAAEGGHYSDMITREDMGSQEDEEQPARGRRGRRGHTATAEDDEQTEDHGA